MRYEEKRVTLADGTIVFLKTPAVEDAQALLDYFRTITAQTRFLSKDIEDVFITLEGEQAWIAKFADHPRAVIIAAYKDARIIASANLAPISGVRHAHRAGMGIAIVKEFWHLGLGTMLMREIISAAQRLGYEYLELSVNGDNERALSLYKRYDFTVFATFKNGILYKDGSYADELQMSLELGNSKEDRGE